MRFADKIRGARGILDITQAQLAAMSGVSEPAVKVLEKGETNPNSRTQKKLEDALYERGVIFTRKGIEVDDSPVVMINDISPEKCYLKLLSDVLEHLSHHKKPELLISNADDKASPPAVNDMYREIRKAGIKMRQLIEEDNTYLIGPVDEYRYIPKENFINRVTLIYGDRVATITDNENTISINKDPINADTRRNIFNLLWNTLKQPTESTADERF